MTDPDFEAWAQNLLRAPHEMVEDVIARGLKQAFDQGYSMGSREGYNEGHMDGYTEGLDLGWAIEQDKEYK